MHENTPHPRDHPQVSFGPFTVADLSRKTLVDTVVRGAFAVAGRSAYVAFALHVGGFNAREDAGYIAALDRADVVYADGVSVVLVARAAGAGSIERAGTTDIGWDILTTTAVALGRPARVALIGGPPGLAERAGRTLAATGSQVVATAHGYHEDWSAVLQATRAAAPDIVLVGLGAPGEMTWVVDHMSDLPPALILTCGGWVGFLAGNEQRAPRWLQIAHGEWLYRVAQAPTRLLPRYVSGATATGRLWLAARRAHRSTPRR